MSKQSELSLISTTKSEIEKAPMNSPPSMNVAERMLSKALESGLNAENVAAFSDLVKLHREEMELQGKRDFARDFTALQKEIPKIQATEPVYNSVAKGGGLRYKFAPLEHIDAQLRPLALKYGFTWSFSEGPERAQKIVKVCTVQHVNGHERSNSYAVRIGDGPPGTTASQADGSAHMYAKRGALCDAFSIVIQHMEADDARLEGAGECISDEAASRFESRVKAAGRDAEKFVKAGGGAGADFKTILVSKVVELDALLCAAERAKGGVK